MGVGGISYPISDEVRQALTRFPKIAAWLELPISGRFELEFVRLLHNTHYEHLDKLLNLVECWLKRAGLIGTRVITTRDPFQLEQALAELFLFRHLQLQLGEAQVCPAKGPPAQPVHDIDVIRNGQKILVEIFIPVDFMGFQLLQRHIGRILKYLDVPRGFALKVRLQSADELDSRYPYDIGDESEVRLWLGQFAGVARHWLQTNKPSPSLRRDGTTPSWCVDVSLTELSDDPSCRAIGMLTSGHSTDTRLFFECGTVEDTARSQWGRKIKRKLCKRQCGDPAPDKLRILVVDFSQASTGWPDFICWPKIAERMDAAIKLLAEKLRAPLPYEAVLPAQLGFECCFGPLIVLDAARQHEATESIGAAGLDKPCKPRPDVQPDWDSLLSGGGDGCEAT